MNSYLRDIAVWLPSRVVSNVELDQAHPGWNLGELTQITGVENRHRAAPGETASDLAYQAALRLFEQGIASPALIDMVIYCSLQPDQIVPSTAIQLQHRLGIPQTSGGFDYSTGCSGYLYGLLMAKGFIESGQAKHVLLLNADTISRWVHPENRSTVALFGDGAAATYLSAESPDGSGRIGQFTFGSDGSGADKISIRNGAARSPFDPSAPESSDEYGNKSSDNHVFMDGSAVLNFSMKVTPRLIRQLCINNNLDIGQIDLFLFHQASRIVLENVARKLRIPENQIVFNLKDVGNTVSASIPMAYFKARADGSIRKGMTLALAAFGAGYSWLATTIYS